MPFIVDSTISHVLENAQARNDGWVFYRLPGTTEIIFTSGLVSEFSPDDTAERIFWVSGFEGNIKGIHPSCNLVVTPDQVRELHLTLENSRLRDSPENKPVFKSGVSKAVAAIQKGQLKKVVLSRTRRINLPEDFNPFTFFIALTQSYPDAFVYMLFLPDAGLWMGSSPELLLKAEGTSLETMSLAGTGRNPDDFTGKERMEQELVSSYIKEKLTPFCQRIKSKDVSVKKAGELFHLCTRIEGLRKQNTSLREIASALHPTAAVCGLPQAAASQFIRENEPHQRLLYSGFLGPVTNEEKAILFVNLRCMQIHEKEAILYAGAGIVEGSDPEAEWNETSQKMDTLLRVIFPDGR